eukprot:scaffold4945_cov61-Attheya_sp.AAC.3
MTSYIRHVSAYFLTYLRVQCTCVLPHVLFQYRGRFSPTQPEGDEEECNLLPDSGTLLLVQISFVLVELK